MVLIFFGEKQRTDRKLDGSSSSHLRSLNNDSNSDTDIQGSEYSEFNEYIDVKKNIKLSVEMTFRNAA